MVVQNARIVVNGDSRRLPSLPSQPQDSNTQDLSAHASLEARCSSTRGNAAREVVRGPRPAPWTPSPMSPPSMPRSSISPLVPIGGDKVTSLIADVPYVEDPEEEQTLLVEDESLLVGHATGLADCTIAASDPTISTAVFIGVERSHGASTVSLTQLTASGIFYAGSRPALDLTVPPQPPNGSSLSPLLPSLSPSCAARCLTDCVTRLGNRPYAQGGFSDVWCGMLTDETRCTAEKVSQTPTILCYADLKIHFRLLSKSYEPSKSIRRTRLHTECRWLASRP